jgi:hypothetical protein
MEDLKFFKSKRNGLKLVYKKYIYNRDTSKTAETRYRCRKRCCRGAIFLNSENKIIREIEHNHKEEENEIKKIECMEMIRENAKNTNETPSKIVANIIKKKIFPICCQILDI